MRIDKVTASGFGVALNEAVFVGAEYDPVRNLLATTFSVLTLPNDEDPEPQDPRRQIVLTKVGRIAAALRDSRWNDPEARPIPFEVSELLSVVQSFGGQPVYGWEFINSNDSRYDHWKNRLSLDLTPRDGSLDNQIMLFQEGTTANRHLDLWIWFSDLLISDALGNIITLSDFIDDGKRWWDALSAGDPRTRGHGIVSGSPDS